MLEVLITIVIVSLGILGLAGLQAHMTVSEIDAFQRAQAVAFLEDITARIRANQSIAADFVASGVGTGDARPADCTTLLPVSTAAERASFQLCEWSNLLKGATELKGTTKVGGAVEMRGCVTAVAGSSPTQYVASVVWRGRTQSFVPGGLTCGAGLYGPVGGADYRRVVSSTISIANLSGA